MVKGPRNIGASVRARLLNLAQQKGQTFDLVLTQFAIERALYRLSLTTHAERFVLKGAMLLMTWLEEPHRGTRDLDLLGFGNPAPDNLLAAFREILGQSVEDGVRFDVDGLHIDRIREETEYGGMRMRTTAEIGGARVSITIDVGFGDSLEPGAESIDYPVMLDFPGPRLRAYARETVIAEKFQAMIALGRANSRMKDFYDVWLLSRSFSFDNDRLAHAIAATFERRGTPIPSDAPDAFTPAFAADEQKQRQWQAFVADVALDPGTLSDVVEELSKFLLPKAARAIELAAK
jgi:predicted nucleotidyltransferase component of viral defense system